MVMFRVFARFCHATKAAAPSTDKSALAALRRKTGYTFSNCKKALDMHNNDLAQAEDWLHKQAQTLGWSKATKLEGRKTTQGLIGVSVQNEHGVLVEVNCETDFVARNNEFESLVSSATNACLNFIKNSFASENATVKIDITPDQLKNLQASDGKTLSDKIALLIGTVGENAILKRAVGFKVISGTYLAGYAHPSGKQIDNVLLGRLGGLVALRPQQENENLDQIAKDICQHIVGMNPLKIGSKTEEREENENKDDETSLIHQEFLLDESVTVKEVLEENGLDVVDFKRFECGETVENN